MTQKKLTTIQRKAVIQGNMKDYYLEMLAAKMNKASDNELTILAKTWGRSDSDTQKDIIKVENLYEAIDIFLNKAV